MLTDPATCMYYIIKNNRIEGYPIISSTSELCEYDCNILLQKNKFCDKNEILYFVYDIDDSITHLKITNNMIILENWLKLYPRFEIRQKK